MNLYCLKCPKFTKTFDSLDTNCHFKKIGITDKEELVIYWKFKLYIKQCYHIVRSVSKNSESKNLRVPKTNKVVWSLQCGIVKNQDLLRNKKVMDY